MIISRKDTDISLSLYRSGIHSKIFYSCPIYFSKQSNIIGIRSVNPKSRYGLSITIKHTFKWCRRCTYRHPTLCSPFIFNEFRYINIGHQLKINTTLIKIITHLTQLNRIQNQIRVILGSRPRSAKLSKHTCYAA